MESYEPTPADIEWARSIVAHIRDGGIWGWPAIGAVYRFDHQAKTITLVRIERLEDFRLEMHQRNGPVFAAVGYTLCDEGTVESVVGDLRFRAAHPLT